MMPHTSKRRGQTQPQEYEEPDGDAQHGRSSQGDLHEPRHVVPIFPRETDRETRRGDDALAEGQNFALASRSAPPSLSAEGQQFAREVKLRDILACAKFITTYPNVLRESEFDRKYTYEAMSALKLGDPESRYLAESYIEKCLIIRNCRGRTTRGITEYLQPLANRDKDAWADFYEDFDLIMDELKSRAKALRTAPTKTPAADPTPGAQSGTIDRHGNIGDVQKAFSQLQVGPKVDYNKAAYSSSPGKGYAVLDSDSYYPKARHAVDPAPTVNYNTAKPGVREERPPPGLRRESQSQLPPIAPSTTNRPRHDPTESAFEETRSQHSELVPSLRGDAMPRVVAIESKLDPRYKKKPPRAAGDFFVIGRVFAMLWHTEHTADDVSRAKWTMTVLGAQVFSHIRRFAVVKQGHGYCWAVPINTYNGQGVRKKGFNRDDIRAHAVIFTQGARPVTLNNEPEMVKRAIEVVPANDDCELEKTSRINFCKVHTVEHNVSVRDFGRVSDDSLPYFTSYWRQHST